MAEIVVESVVKEFPGGVRAVDDVSVVIEDGEFVVLVGPSGSGKTTLLRMIAGLEAPSSGRILIGGRDVVGVAPGSRDIAMVFQNYALYPHMTVRKNIGYGLKVRGMPKAQITERVATVSKMLGLEDLLDRRPSQLSGGQRQRVAMGRAIAREPQAYLMDEPLSNLDAKLRVRMRSELARLHAELGVTSVYVTHDQVEAMTLGQRVAVMRDGAIAQLDAPQRLYREPVNLYVAAFVGSPAMNFVNANVANGVATFGGIGVQLERDHRPPTDGPVVLGLRPEAFEDAAFASRGLSQIDVVVEVIEELGSDVYVFFGVDAPRVETDEIATAQEEDAALLRDGRLLFCARVDERTGARVGAPLRLAIDPGRLHFFDSSSGVRLTAAATSAPSVPLTASGS